MKQRAGEMLEIAQCTSKKLSNTAKFWRTFFLLSRVVPSLNIVDTHTQLLTLFRTIITESSCVLYYHEKNSGPLETES